MKKNAFSYIELIFAMVIVVALMAMSGPLLSKRVQKSSERLIQGEYECWRVDTYDNTGAITNTQFCQHQKTDEDTEFSEATCAESCQFFRQTNVEEYNITLYGAGGGGSSFYALAQNGNPFNTQETQSNIEKNKLSEKKINCNFSETDITDLSIFKADDIRRILSDFHHDDIVISPSCTLQINGTTNNFTKIKLSVYRDEIAYKPAQNGASGSINSFSLPLQNMPFQNDAIRIDATNAENAVQLGTSGKGEIAVSGIKATDGEDTTFTAVNAEGSLPSQFCHGNTCTAKGGAAGDADLSEESKETICGENENYSKKILRLIMNGDNVSKQEKYVANLLQGKNMDNILNVLNQNKKYDPQSDIGANKPYQSCLSGNGSISDCAKNGAGQGGEYAAITTENYDTQYYLILEPCIDSGCFDYKTLLEGTDFTADRAVKNYFGNGGNGLGGAIRITW